MKGFQWPCHMIKPTTGNLWSSCCNAIVVRAGEVSYRVWGLSSIGYSYVYEKLFRGTLEASPGVGLFLSTNKIMFNFCFAFIYCIVLKAVRPISNESYIRTRSCNTACWSVWKCLAHCVVSHARSRCHKWAGQNPFIWQYYSIIIYGRVDVTEAILDRNE